MIVGTTEKEEATKSLTQAQWRGLVSAVLRGSARAKYSLKVTEDFEVGIPYDEVFVVAAYVAKHARDGRLPPKEARVTTLKVMGALENEGTYLSSPDLLSTHLFLQVPPAYRALLCPKELDKKGKKPVATKDEVIKTFLRMLFAYSPVLTYNITWLCRTTVAVEAGYYKDLLNMYKSYLSYEYGVSKKAVDPMVSKLDSLFDPEEYYLVDGDPREEDAFITHVRTLNLRSHYPGMGLLRQLDSGAKFWEAEGQIFWGSTEYEDVDGFDPKEATVLGGKYGLSKHCFQQWLNRGPVNIRNFPSDDKGAAMKLFLTYLSAARRVNRANNTKQTLKHQAAAHYLTSEGWIFVVQEPGLLVTCYYKGDITAHGYHEIPLTKES